MCGIAGAVRFGGTGAEVAAVDAAATLLAHRGPDGSGMLALGIDGAWCETNGVRRALAASASAHTACVVISHRRLAIIDLSAAAAQPFCHDDDRYVLAWNGELYNYIEVRAALTAEGHACRTASDTEVFVAAWAAWGPRALDRFTGMFAFALVDRATGVLWLGRDPFGQKPLYWASTHDGLVFGSECAAVLALRGGRAHVDANALADFLLGGVTDRGAATMFRGIEAVPAAHLLRVDLRTLRTPEQVRYWTLAESPADERGPDVLAAELRALVHESMRLHVRSDVPVGTLLSGGVDSSAITASARAVLGRGAPLTTISYRPGDEAFDEGPWIDIVNEVAGCRPVSVRLSAGDLDACWDALTLRQGEPFGTPAVFVQAMLFRAAAAAGVRVVLDGQGADELFGGYTSARGARLAGQLRRGELIAAGRFARALRTAGIEGTERAAAAILLGGPLARWRTLRGAAPYGPLADAAWMRARGVALPIAWSAPTGAVLQARLHDGLFATSMPALIRYADRSAMASSVENRLPFLTRELAEFASRVPDALLVGDDGTGKPLLRAAMRGVVPEAVLDRRTKTGFAVPWVPWLRESKRIGGLIADGARLPGIASRQATRLALAARARAQMGPREVAAAWRLAGLAAWVERYDVVMD